MTSREQTNSPETAPVVAREFPGTTAGGARARLAAAEADHLAAVRAQLAPIPSRSALLDSYRRESLNNLTPSTQPEAAWVEVLDRAYALRWQELQPDRGLELESLHSAFEMEEVALV